MNKVKKIATIFVLVVAILGVSSLYTSTSVSASPQDTWITGDTEYEPRIMGEMVDGIEDSISSEITRGLILSPSARATIFKLLYAGTSSRTGSVRTLMHMWDAYVDGAFSFRPL